jgi:hypothetical protein
MTGLGLQRISDRPLGFPLEVKRCLREPLNTRAEGLRLNQCTQSRRVDCFLVVDINLPQIRALNCPIPKRLQRRSHSLEKIESGAPSLTGPLPTVQQSDDQMRPGISVQEVVPCHYRHYSYLSSRMRPHVRRPAQEAYKPGRAFDLPVHPRSGRVGATREKKHTPPSYEHAGGDEARDKFGGSAWSRPVALND